MVLQSYCILKMTMIIYYGILCDRIDYGGGHVGHFVTVRDGPLEKLWGGGRNFRSAGIFFRYQIPCMNFF